jgi:hypothetical protein
VAGDVLALIDDEDSAKTAGLAAVAAERGHRRHRPPARMAASMIEAARPM